MIRTCVPTAGGMGLIPGWGTKILQATQCDQNINNFFKFKRKIILCNSHYFPDEENEAERG